jgi:hypothetical protein
MKMTRSAVTLFSAWKQRRLDAFIDRPANPAGEWTHYGREPTLLVAAELLAECAYVSGSLLFRLTQSPAPHHWVASNHPPHPPRWLWNILLAARNEGFGGTITTMAVCGAGDENRTRMASLEDENRDALTRQFPYVQRKRLTLISRE